MELGGGADLWVGRRFGGYQVQAVLGRGAVAVVYEVLRADGAPAALKVLTPMAESQRQVRELFAQEWRIMRRLSHPAIMGAHQYGEYGGSHYLELDLVEGATFGDRLMPSGRLSPAEAIGASAAVADGLQHAHERRVVHRDVKPSNVMSTLDDQAVLFDFGLALDLDGPPPAPGRVFGSPYWLSPEQARAEPVDGRADVYGLGATLFRFVTGQAPFYGERSDLLHAHCHEPVPDPAELAPVSRGLAEVVRTAMAKAPEDRYQTAASMAEALRALDPDEPADRGARPGLLDRLRSRR